MKKVFIIHGSGGMPNGGWRSWLMGELSVNDIWACSLAMPTPNTPQKDEWVKTIQDAIKTSTEDEIFLVGHSLGVPAILHYLESLDINSKINGAVLVSGPVFEIEKDERGYINSFLNKPFNFDHIKNVCKSFSVIHGSDDPVVPFSEAEYLSEKFSCNLISISNGKHLNGSAGFNKLPEVLSELLKMIDNK